MVKKSNLKKEEGEENKDIFKTWADSYIEVSEMWEDSYEKLYKPWIESCGEMFEKTALLTKEAAPQKYREFYDEWVKTYQDTFGKFYMVPTPESNKELLEKFILSADESNKLYRSWIAELEENSKKTRDLLQGKPDPVKYKECYDLWMKSYEKMFEGILKLPSQENTKKLFGDCMGKPDIYMEGFLQMSKLWKKSYTQICRPMNESMMKLSEKMAEISRGDAGPESYKEFYTLWVNTYKDTYGKYATSMDPSIFKNFSENTNLYLSIYKSWITALETMSEKAQELFRHNSDPEVYKEFYHLWINTYEKAFQNFFEDIPVVGEPMKEIMEPVKIMAKMYSDTFTKMMKMGVKSGARSATAYPGKNKKR
ncbi:MAG: hypothetical protein OIN83_01870 [Candidatus Methanoperedens sp.]|nr:hypothetical protein [Candidatus Methanoperedens sp.]